MMLPSAMLWTTVREYEKAAEREHVDAGDALREPEGDGQGERVAPLDGLAVRERRQPVHHCHPATRVARASGSISCALTL